MITAAELKDLANDKALAIGDAWDALDQAAERIEYMECWLRPVVERMRLEAKSHQYSDCYHAARLEAFAKDIETSYTGIRKP